MMACFAVDQPLSLWLLCFEWLSSWIAWLEDLLGRHSSLAVAVVTMNVFVGVAG